MSAPLIQFDRFSHPTTWWLKCGSPPWLDDPRWYARAARSSLVLGLLGFVSGCLTTIAVWVMQSVGSFLGFVFAPAILPGLLFAIITLIPLSRWQGRGWNSTLFAIPISVLASFCGAFTFNLYNSPGPGGAHAGFVGALIVCVWMGHPRQKQTWVAGILASATTAFACGLVMNWNFGNLYVFLGVPVTASIAKVFPTFQCIVAVSLGVLLWLPVSEKRFDQFTHPLNWWFRCGPPPWLEDPRWYVRAIRASGILGLMGVVSGGLTTVYFLAFPSSVLYAPGLSFALVTLIPLSRWLGRSWYMTLLAIPIAVIANFCGLYAYLNVEGRSEKVFIAIFVAALMICAWMGHSQPKQSWIASLLATALAMLGGEQIRGMPYDIFDSYNTGEAYDFPIAFRIVPFFQIVMAVGLAPILWLRPTALEIETTGNKWRLFDRISSPGTPLNRNLRVLFASLMMIAVLGLWIWSRANSPNRWVEMLGDSLNPHEGQHSNHAKAEAAIRAIGPACVPALTAALFDRRVYMRHAGAEGLGWFPNEAGPAIPELFRVMANDTSQVRGQAAKTLRSIGPAIVPLMISILDDYRAHADHVVAVEALGWFPTEAAPATRRMIMFLAISNDREVRSKVETTLRAIGPSVVPELTAALSNSAGHVRQAGAEGLSWFPSESRPAIPLLIRLLRDDESRVQLQAAKTLRSIGPSVASELAIALSNSDARIRQVAAEGLTWFPAVAEPAIPLLIKSLADKVQSVRTQASDALAIIAKDADSTGLAAIPLVICNSLRESLTDLNPFVRISAARALIQIDSGDVEAMNELRRCVVIDTEAHRKISELRGGDEWQRWLVDHRAEEEYRIPYSLEAVGALFKIGPAALPALPELIAATRPNSDPRLAKSTHEETMAILAVKTIGIIGPQAKSAIPILMNLIARSATLGTPAIEALVQIGPVAIPQVTESLSDPAQDMRVAAITVLGQFGPRAAVAVPELARLKSDKDPVVVNRVLYALKKIEEK